MFEDETHAPVTTAVEARDHLIELEAERALASAAGLAGIAAYMQDLNEEIEQSRHHYVRTAVTEIATMRAELSGPNAG